MVHIYGTVKNVIVTDSLKIWELLFPELLLYYVIPLWANTIVMLVAEVNNNCESNICLNDNLKKNVML